METPSRPNLSEKKAVLFDLDGTVYYGSKIIPGANDTITFFRDRGIRVYFATNNSTKTRKQIFERLCGMGVDCRLEEVLTSGYLAALYALRKGLKDIHIFGSPNLVEEFENLGVTVSHDGTAENLLIGYNPDMTYEDLTMAVRVALNAKRIIACNREKVFPGEGAKLFPGCGAMTAPVEWCANRSCDVVVGKPSTFMIETVMEEDGLGVDELLMVGDSYESDIAMARAAGCDAILISSDERDGVLTAASIREIPRLMLGTE